MPRSPFDETGDAVRIAAGPGELPTVESWPYPERSAPRVALGDGLGRALQAAVQRLASCNAIAPVRDVRVGSNWQTTMRVTDETNLKRR